MNRTKYLTLVGLSAIALMVVLHGIGKQFSHPPKTVERVNWKTSEPTNAIFEITGEPKDVVIGQPRFFAELQTNKDGAIYGKEIQTVRMDLETERYKKMKQAMIETLATLGIASTNQNDKKFERTVQKLVSARIKSDWSKVPDWWSNAPDTAALEAFKLKRTVAYTLSPGTYEVVEKGVTNLVPIPADTLTIKRVLETEGPALPPMADYQLRKGQNAVYDEAKALEAMK